MALFNGKFKSATVEWPTPQDMFDRLNARFHFTLDVCATPENAKCPVFFTKEMDGLAQEWSGVCWMNPPYGRAMIAWLKKAVAEKANGVTTVALIPARTNTGWWHDIVQANGEVEFVRGRPRFGGATHGLPQPLALVIFKANNDAQLHGSAIKLTRRVQLRAENDALGRTIRALVDGEECAVDSSPKNG